MALTNAEKQRRFRERQRVKRERVDRVFHFIDAFEDIELLLEQLDARLLDLKLCYSLIRARMPIGDSKDVT